jgi:4'-phosphopantetheinyl transferase
MDMCVDAARQQPGHTIAMPAPSSPQPPADVRARYASTDVLRDRPDLAVCGLAAFGGAERERYDRFRHDIDRHMFLLGRLMARALVGRALGCDPRAWTWRDGPRGRPEVGGPATPVRFNLAHSAGLVACVVACGRDVGVDVEDLERRQPEPDIVERYCAPAEVADIRAQGDGWSERFLRYWTLKEAYLKARGLGIAVPLAEISFALDGESSARIAFLGSLRGTDDAWSFVLARPTNRHLLAVAASSPEGPHPSVSIGALDAGELCDVWLPSGTRAAGAGTP